jgi:hypothetical protein
MNIQYFKNTYESFQNETSSDIPKVEANLLLWLDPNDPNNDKNKPEENSVLNYWVDKSTGQKDAVAITPGKIVKNDTNSNMILRLDKNLNYFIKYPSFPNGSFTIITVQRSSGKADFSRLIHAPGASDTAVFIGTRNGNIATFTGTDNWNDFEQNTPVLSNLNTWRIVTTVVDDKNLYPYVDGTPLDNKIGITKPFEDFIIGYSDDQSWIGDVGDILMFDKALTLADRIKIETFLSKKWDIKLNVISEEPKRIPFAELLNKNAITSQVPDKKSEGGGGAESGAESEGEWVYSEDEQVLPEQHKNVKRHRLIKKILKKKAIKLEAFTSELLSNIFKGLLK